MSTGAHALHERYNYAEGLGGSAVAVVLGMSRFRTKRELYERIIADQDGIERDDADNRYAWWGRQLEDAIASAFTVKTGMKLRRSFKTHRHPRYPFLIAHVDRLGYGFVFEAKTTGAYNADVWGETVTLDELTPETWAGGGWRELVSDDIPDEYGLQLQHYMAVTRKPHAFLVVLIGGNEARLYHAEYDHELYTEGVMPKLVEFWREHVEKRVPPELTAEDEALVRRRHPVEEDEELVIASAEAEKEIERYVLASLNEKQAAAVKAEAQARIEAEIGDHTGLIGSTHKVTWKRSKDSPETAWELVAKAYRGIIEHVAPWAGVDPWTPEMAREMDAELAKWRDVDLDAIESLHTNVKPGSRRFNLKELKKGERE